MTRGVFGNALKFSHFEALANVVRTPFESNKHETNLSMKLTAQVQARILSKTHREPANKPETTNKLKKKTTNGTRRRKQTDGKETPKPATEEDKARPV